MALSRLESLIKWAWENGCHNTSVEEMSAMDPHQLFIDMHYKDSCINEYPEKEAEAAIKRFHENGYKF